MSMGSMRVDWWRAARPLVFGCCTFSIAYQTPGAASSGRIRSARRACNTSPILSTPVHAKAMMAPSLAQPQRRLSVTKAIIKETGKARWCSWGSSTTQLNAKSHVIPTCLRSAGRFDVIALIVSEKRPYALPDWYKSFPYATKASFIVSTSSACLPRSSSSVSLKCSVSQLSKASSSCSRLALVEAKMTLSGCRTVPARRAARCVSPEPAGCSGIAWAHGNAPKATPRAKRAQRYLFGVLKIHLFPLQLEVQMGFVKRQIAETARRRKIQNPKLE